MKTSNPFLRFSLLFGILYFGLTFLFLGFGTPRVYEQFFCKTSEKLLQNISTEAVITCRLSNDKSSNLDVEYIFRNRRELEKARAASPITGKPVITDAGKWGLDSTSRGLMPTVLLLCLIMAFPANFRRKIWAILWGGVLLHLFIFFRLGCSLFLRIEENQIIFPGYALTDWQRNFCRYLDSIPFELMYAVVVLLFAMVMIRKEDLPNILKKPAGGRKIQKKKGK